MTKILRVSVALAPVFLAACVSGTDVFQVPPDAGPSECERPETPHVLTELITFGTYIEPSDEFRGPCVPSLEVSAGGLVDCQLVERRATACTSLPGRTYLRDEIDALGMVSHVCELLQVADADGVGWEHQSAADLGRDSEVAMYCGTEGGRLTFRGVTLGPNASLEILCALPGPRWANGLGARCGMIGPEAWASCGVARREAAPPVLMTCDAETDRCAVSCTTDADCADAGLTGETCAERGVCVIPDCFAP